MVVSSGCTGARDPSSRGVYDHYPVIMFRTCETYDFYLVDSGETGCARIPCRVEITSRRDGPDVDPCYPVVDATTDGRFSMVTRSVIMDRIADTINGKSIDGPLLDHGPTNHAPEFIAVWAYWFAHDQSRIEREYTDWQLTIESVRVVVGGRWWCEYAPTFGDR